MKLPDVPMSRIFVHWTAGSYTPNATDLKAYHVLIDGSGEVHMGKYGIERNSGKLSNGYAAHTLNCNTGSIGVSLCCMGGAIESPYNPGKWPMKEVQFNKLVEVVAVLCKFYGIPVTPTTVLSHAEVEANLGIKQRAKWDYTVLPFADKPKMGAAAIGKLLRERVVAEMTKVNPLLPPIPAGALVEVLIDTPTYRSPSGSELGKLPKGTKVTVDDMQGDWLNVTSPAGYTGWVPAARVRLLDGPQPTAPTTPNPIRDKINQVRAMLDEIEGML